MTQIERRAYVEARAEALRAASTRHEERATKLAPRTASRRRELSSELRSRARERAPGGQLSTKANNAWIAPATRARRAGGQVELAAGAAGRGGAAGDGGGDGGAVGSSLWIERGGSVDGGSRGERGKTKADEAASSARRRSQCSTRAPRGPRRCGGLELRAGGHPRAPRSPTRRERRGHGAQAAPARRPGASAAESVAAQQPAQPPAPTRVSRPDQPKRRSPADATGPTMTEGGGGGGGGGGRGQKACGDNQLTLNQMDVNECLGSWLAYLQMLNGLCSAGTKLALSLQALLSGHESGAPAAPCRVTSQCLAGWEELTRATNVASHTVRKHVVTAMKDYEVLDSDGDKADILRDNLLTFINLQYQFCVACCKCLGSMAECSCTQDGSECDIAALQQCFERLYSSPPAAASASAQPGQRSPLPPSLFPLQVRRRWSETAATSADMAGGEAAEQAVRRWSMPWDCRHVSEWPPRQAEPGGAARARLRVPAAERSRSATPDARWRAAMSSQDGLREAIQLLSCRPGVRVYGGHVPGVTLTPCGLDAGPAWPDSAAGAAAAAAAAARAWPHRDSHSSDHSDHSTSHSTHSGLSGPRDSELSAGSGSAHGDSKDSVHSHSDYGGRGESDAGALELLSSRKNSSSTDSCVSAHSRSGSESAPAAGDSLRSNLYSMWSGSDLPFIRLPESSEIKDDSALV